MRIVGTTATDDVMEDQPATPDEAYIDALSRLTAQSFASLDDAMTTIVAFVAEQVGTRSSFLSRIDADQATLEVLVAFNAADGCAVNQGEVIPLPHTF